jgi:hypothetical protein
MAKRLANMKNKARSITHKRSLSRLQNSVKSLFEAIYHCVHFIFRDDELVQPLVINSETGKMSESIAGHELHHFFRNGLAGEGDHLADNLLEFCKVGSSKKCSQFKKYRIAKCKRSQKY